MKKKILTCAAFVVVCISAQSQNALKADPANQPKRLTTAEANALNGTAQPTIDGKPYSQYKAEQDALKSQEAARIAAAKTAPSDVVAITPATRSNYTPKQQEAPKFENDGYTKPVVTETKPELITKTEEKPVSAQPSFFTNPGSVRPAQETNGKVPAQAEPLKGATRSAAEIEKAKHDNEAKVQAVKTEEKPNSVQPQPIDLKVVIGTGTETKPLPSNKQQN